LRYSSVDIIRVYDANKSYLGIISVLPTLLGTRSQKDIIIERFINESHIAFF